MPVVQWREAAQECTTKEDFGSCLDLLREERDRILACERDAKQKSQDLLEVTKSEREKTLAEFRKLRQFLEEQEQYLLEQMEEVEKEIARERDARIAKLTAGLSSLENAIQEMEEKIQKPVRDFLKDVRNTLQRCEKERFENPPENPLAFPPELKWRIWDFRDLNFFLEGVMKQFKGNKEEVQGFWTSPGPKSGWV
uniref:Uncharacterized protein n=1 Tax=Sphaerodactylus townsendi TaxID=933632 RepID=A0ACB8EG20_9SAUR